MKLKAAIFTKTKKFINIKILIIKLCVKNSLNEYTQKILLFTLN